MVRSYGVPIFRVNMVENTTNQYVIDAYMNSIGLGQSVQSGPSCSKRR